MDTEKDEVLVVSGLELNDPLKIAVVSPPEVLAKTTRPLSFALTLLFSALGVFTRLVPSTNCTWLTKVNRGRL